MWRLAWTAVVALVLVVALHVVSEKFSFDHNAHFVGSLIVLFLVSLTNREAIYHGRWPGRRESERAGR
ncbi:MAG: hypothetical protein M3N56_14510 [Actinomycetota bacterium]|nr:hypothetical protein [Actinomycetota bacterium]